ncbi:hypothetical protein ACFLUB_01165 [Chloroflexota bacterium]
MEKSGNKLLLLFGPTVTVVGINFLSTDILRGLGIILLAVFLTVVGSYFQWIEPKDRSKFWLIFPGLFSALGYIPLVIIRTRKRIIDRLSRGFKIHESTDSWDIFTFIAARVTKYYLEITRNHKDRLNDEVMILASAGLLEEHDYIEEKISLSQIIKIAKRSVLVKEEALVDFIINLEVELFKVDVPEIDISEISEACFEKRADIEHVVQIVERGYVRETEFSWATTNLMGLIESQKFRGFREALGIINPVLYENRFEQHILTS